MNLVTYLNNKKVFQSVKLNWNKSQKNTTSEVNEKYKGANGESVGNEERGLDLWGVGVGVGGGHSIYLYSVSTGKQLHRKNPTWLLVNL